MSTSLINTLLGDALQIIVQEAEANKATILAAAAAANVTVENAADAFIDSIKVNGALAVILPTLKSGLKNAVNNAIASGATNEETVLFNLLLASAQNKVKVLLG